MKWSEIAAQEPALGKVAHQRLIEPGVLLIGTTRRDGSARISGVEPLVTDGGLWLSMMRTSVKAADLARDPRIQLHSVVTGPEPATEIKIRGTAHAVPDGQLQRDYACTGYQCVPRDGSCGAATGEVDADAHREPPAGEDAQ